MIEFINTLLFGADYPGLSLALDPITMMLMAQGAGKLVQGGVQAFRGNQKQKGAQTIYDKQIADFRAGKYDNTLGQGVYDAATDQQNLLSNAANLAREGARSGVSGSIASTRYGDPRNNALLGIQNTNAMNSATNADMSAAMNIGGVGTELAGKEQGVLAQNQGLRQQLESMITARAAGNIDLGSSMTDAGWGTAIGGLGDTVGARLGDGDIMEYLTSGRSVPKSVSTSVESENKATALEALLRGEEYGLGMPTYPSREKGGRVPSYGLGGTAPQMLPGEFDHESNPIHMVDDNGEKVGEATGGELVFNPDQTNDIQEIISMGDEEALMDYMAKLLSKPQFQEGSDYEETTFA